MAVLSGDHLRGALGAIIATLGLIFPGGLFVLGIGVIYASAADHPSVNLILGGIAAAATGLLAAITYKIGDSHWRHVKSLGIIVCTFALMSILKLSLPYVILIMAPISIYLYRPGRQV
jgi:chromate transporter